MSVFAQDSFIGGDGVLGGDLVDVGTPLAARDKIQHLVAGILLAQVLVRWAAAGPWAVVGTVAAAALAWEIVELVRMVAWEKHGLGAPPLVTDYFSWRDIVATLAGAGVSLAVL